MRQRTILITPELLYLLFEQGNRIDAVCVEGLPKGANFIKIVREADGLFGLTFESGEWDTSHNELYAPYLVVKCKTLYTDALLEQASTIISAIAEPQSPASFWLTDYWIWRGQRDNAQVQD